MLKIEEFAGNHFGKYVNNNGAICFDEPKEIQQKAESLALFSYAKSKGKLLVLDIQGSGYKLTDSEIATVNGKFDEDNNLLFCAGNLSKTAFFTFFQTTFLQ